MHTKIRLRFQQVIGGKLHFGEQWAAIFPSAALKDELIPSVFAILVS